MMLPMPMKSLDESQVSNRRSAQGNRLWSYPNIDPEPTMYFPRVLMTPAWPAPYWKIVTVPARIAGQWCSKGWNAPRRTVDEAHDSADSCRGVSSPLVVIISPTHFHPSACPFSLRRTVSFDTSKQRAGGICTLVKPGWAMSLRRRWDRRHLAALPFVQAVVRRSEMSGKKGSRGDSCSSIHSQHATVTLGRCMSRPDRGFGHLTAARSH
jgi:hypothetical protein